MSGSTIRDLLKRIAAGLGVPVPNRHAVTRWVETFRHVPDSGAEALEASIAARNKSKALPSPSRAMTWFKADGGRSQAPGPVGCAICNPGGQVGQVDVFLAVHLATAKGRQMPWASAKNLLAGGHPLQGWTVSGFKVVCDCREAGGLRRLLDAWMQPDRQDVIDHLIERAPALVQKDYRAQRDATRALAERLGAGKQYTLA